MQSTYDRIHFYKLGQKEKTKIIHRLEGLMSKENRVKLAILFGSVTRRENIRDIDLCIHSTPKLNFKDLLDLNAKIELTIGMPIDLVELTNLPTTLQTNILKNGTIIKGQKTLANKLLNQTYTPKAIATSS